MVKSTVVDSATGKSKDSRSVYLLLIIFSVVHFICIKVPFQWLQKYRCCLLMCWTASDEFLSVVEISRVLVLWLRRILISSGVNSFFTSSIEQAVGWWIVVLLECRVRTSSGTFLSRGQDKVITGIEQRIADFTFIPLGMSSPNHYYTGSDLRNISTPSSNQIDWWSWVMLPCKWSLFVASFKLFLILHIFTISTRPVQSKVRGCKSCNTKWVKSTRLTMITFMMNSIQRMVVSELQLYLCTCRWSSLSSSFLYCAAYDMCSFHLATCAKLSPTCFYVVDQCLCTCILYDTPPFFALPLEFSCKPISEPNYGGLVVGSTDVEQGGETVFPASRVNSSEVPHWDELSECAQKGLSVRPRMGDALLFWSMKPDATLDSTSLHGGSSDQFLAVQLKFCNIIISCMQDAVFEVVKFKIMIPSWYVLAVQVAVLSLKEPSGQPRSGCMLTSMQYHKVCPNSYMTGLYESTRILFTPFLLSLVWLEMHWCKIIV